MENKLGTAEQNVTASSSLKKKVLWLAHIVCAVLMLAACFTSGTTGLIEVGIGIGLLVIFGLISNKSAFCSAPLPAHLLHPHHKCQGGYGQLRLVAEQSLGNAVAIGGRGIGRFSPDAPAVRCSVSELGAGRRRPR